MQLRTKSTTFAIGLVSLLALGLIAFAGARADKANPSATEQSQKCLFPTSSIPPCSLGTLRGTYGGSTSGTLLPNNEFGAPAGPYHDITVINFGGGGTGLMTATIKISGQTLPDLPAPIPINYTLNADCTGTATNEFGSKARMVVVDSGQEIHFISLNAGVNATGILKKM